MFLRLVALTYLLCLFSQAALAQNAPDIALRSDAELGAYQQSGLTLENLSISVDVHAGLAQVSLFAALRNETEEDAEAQFAYPLPPNAVINGYALDIDGELVDGVLLPKERAEKLYTDRVTQSVDPGIAARTVDNRYQTRIYPITANGGRRSIQLDFTVPVPANGLRLPFSSDASIESVTLQVQGEGAETAKLPLKNKTTLNTTIDGDIFIPAMPSSPALSKFNGTTLLTVPLASNARPKTRPVQSAVIIWDSSLSRETSDLGQEQRFVRDVLTGLNLSTQSLIHGADRIDLAATYQNPADLINTLGNLQYDGATDLSALLNVEALERADIQADICLIITDGHSTLGQSQLTNLPCRAFTYSTSKTPNKHWFSLLASRNAGTDVSGLSAADAVRLMTSQNELGLAPNQTGEIFHFGNRAWFIAPVDKTPRHFQIKFHDSEKDILLPKLPKATHPAAAALWGQRRIETLRAGGPSRFDDIVAASRRWSVQTQETSFLVLESVDEYIQAELTPPRNFPTDRMADYKTNLAEYREEKAEEQKEHRDEIARLWKAQIKWWETDWSDQGNETTCWDGSRTSDRSTCPAESAPMPAPVVVEAMPESASAPGPVLNDVRRRSDNDCGDCDMIVVTGSRRESRAGQLPSEITIALRPWSPKRPFLTALEGLEGEAFELEYRRQRKTHGDRPSFYLELADQLHRAGRTDRATTLVSTALDLPTLTSLTQSNVADRLLMYGQVDLAIEIYRDVLVTAKDRPQPFYNLALALIQAGDNAKGDVRTQLYGEAFTHLLHVINNSWEEEYDGIHLIALQDLNRTLDRLSKRQKRKFKTELGLDEKFYRNLDTDIRVLVDWTAADADIDIHVIEAAESETSEKAYYSNQLTKRGGRISNDMTDGYGPEEYLIRKAPSGLYRIESNYYSQDDYTEDGALKLRARIWRNFGRKNESFETVIIEMLEEKEEAYILGEVQIGRKK